MIRSFKSKALAELAEKGKTAKLPVSGAHKARVERVLASLKVAKRAQDLDIPGYAFHELKGDRRGTYAVKASGNYRVTFRFDGEYAIDVDIEDYHGE